MKSTIDNPIHTDRVSIIIPMYNAETTIASCLDALFKLNYPKDDLEVIVVDHSSTDSSHFIARQYSVKILQKKGGTISSVRNYGAQSALGEIYAFVDSDCVVHEDWLQNAIEVLKRPDVSATGSGYTCPENCTWVEKAWLYESKHAAFQTNFITSGNFIIKAEAFQSIGGFNEGIMTCEDAEICLRLLNRGHKLINSSEIRVTHLGNPKTIRTFIKKETWYGKNMAATLRLNYFDKVFSATLLFALANIGIILGVIQAVVFRTTQLFFGSILVLCGVLLFSTLYRIRRSKKIALFFHTFVLYYFYFLARVIGISASLAKNRWTKG